MNAQSLTSSTFNGFSKHREDIDLFSILLKIQEGACKKPIEHLRNALALGNSKEAASIKKQLPCATLSATYRERRIPEKIHGYNDVIMLDFDKLTPSEIKSCRQVIQTDPNTLFCFLSPSGNGLKVGVYLTTEEAGKLRKETLQVEKIVFNKLERYHKQMFEFARKYYETLTNVKLDPSGSDIGRLFFYSFDPDIYINAEAIGQVDIPQITIEPPAGKKEKSNQKLIRQDMPGKPETDCQDIPAHVQTLFLKCKLSQEINAQYQPGQRDTFLFALGHRCYKKHLPLEDVERLAEKYYGAPDMDVREPIRNAYQYTTKSDRLEAEKNRPLVIRIIEYIDKKYKIRRNTVLQRLEICPIETEDFQVMKKQDFNTLFVELHQAGINCQPGFVKNILDSRYAVDYNPFEGYFYALPPWDGITDHIAQLAETIQTRDQRHWHECLRRWLIGLVACALDERVTNQLALVITGLQASGKSTWIRSLLPDELRQYYRNGMIYPDNKDHMLLLSQCLFINLEEFEGMTKGTIGDLKRMITQESVQERKAFDTDSDLYVRRASFIASTNERRFLEDLSGSRRFPTITALSIDYKTPVNLTGIYSQALHLWKAGYRYWFEGAEVENLNEQNLDYTLSPPEEELFFVHYRHPLPNDISVQWKPIASIMAHIALYSRFQMTKRSARLLSQVLETNNFRKRMSKEKITEYEVLELAQEDIVRNFKTMDPQEVERRKGEQEEQLGLGF